jgi:Sec-independent protein translocase protein TatA
MFGIPPPELVIIAVVAILLFYDWPLPPIGGAKAPK